MFIAALQAETHICLSIYSSWSSSPNPLNTATSVDTSRALTSVQPRWFWNTRSNLNINGGVVLRRLKHVEYHDLLAISSSNDTLKSGDICNRSFLELPALKYSLAMSTLSFAHFRYQSHTSPVNLSAARRGWGNIGSSKLSFCLWDVGTRWRNVGRCATG